MKRIFLIFLVCLCVVLSGCNSSVASYSVEKLGYILEDGTVICIGESQDALLDKLPPPDKQSEDDGKVWANDWINPSISVMYHEDTVFSLIAHDLSTTIGISEGDSREKLLNKLGTGLKIEDETLGDGEYYSYLFSFNGVEYELINIRNESDLKNSLDKRTSDSVYVGVDVSILDDKVEFISFFQYQ